MNDTTNDQLAAFHAHRERMEKLKQITRELYREHLVATDQVSATEYYAAEAEFWLVDATK